MRKIEIIAADEVRPAAVGEYPLRHCRASGTVESALASPAEAGIWLVCAELAPGSSLEWREGHGDEAIYVRTGELEIETNSDPPTSCPRGGAVILEAGATARLRPRGAADSTRIVHFGAHRAALPVDTLREPVPSPGAVHVVGPRGTWEATGDGRDTRFFADATCEGCRSWLLYTSRSFAYESQTHSHSQDELIHVLWGEIEFGAHRLGPGATLFIAADQPYRFRASEDGFGFLNYRADASWMTTQGAAAPILEAGHATGLVRVADAFEIRPGSNGV